MQVVADKGLMVDLAFVEQQLVVCPTGGTDA